ncbi:penicillin-binding protein 1A [Thalassotalea fusca]
MLSFKHFVKFSIGFTLTGLIAIFALYLALRSDLPSVSSLKDVKWQTPMQIYSSDGKLMNQFGEKKRVPLALDQFPQQLIDAILATEDDRFYLHFGVDPVGMGRAILGKLMGQNKGGASTITMQVARNFFLSPEVTYIRKIREIFTAFHIEYLLSKDEILSLYLNKIPLGHRSYGFGAAAQVYYGKDIQDLTLAQIAVLAGLPKAPSTINPITSPTRAKARRAVVLQRMLVSGYITQEQYHEARNAPITAKKHGAEIELNAPYVAEMAHQKMVEMYGEEQAYTGGFKVFTTVASHTQLAAEKAVVKNLHAYDQRHGYRGPLASLRTQNQQVKPSPKDGPIEAITPLTDEEIQTALAQFNTYHHLQLAVVTQVEQQSAIVTLASGEQATIDWQGMAWARRFITDDKQGPAPKSAADILQYGDVIYVSNLNDSYQLDQLPQASGAMVALSPDDGSVKAVVGGYSFEQSQFNRVTQAKRQVGSNIKPFVYSAALDNGFTLASLVNDAPINHWDEATGVSWRPKNSPERYDGLIRVRIALAQSKNVVAVRLFREVGVDNIIAHLTSFGFAPDDLPKNESLALGSAALTPLEIATGMATFANGGFLVEPYVIDRIEDSFGNIVYQTNPTLACEDCDQWLQDRSLTADTSGQSVNNELVQNKDILPLRKAPRVITAQNAFLITEALNEAIWGADWSIAPGWQGTGWRARKLKRRDIAGKTGTTNEAKDAWFTGYSRRLVATSWIGFDDPSRNLGRSARNSNLPKDQIVGNEYGARSAQPAWVDFMKIALQDIPPEPFRQPADLLSVRIDKHSGKLTTKTDKSSLFEFFKLGTAPTTYDTKDNSSVILDGNQSQEDVDIF